MPYMDAAAAAHQRDPEQNVEGKEREGRELVEYERFEAAGAG